jgi:hypothetical protein
LSNIYFTKKYDPFILTIQISILFLMHIEYYSLIWLKSKKNTEADIKGNPTDTQHVEYQEYLNIKNTYSK